MGKRLAKCLICIKFWCDTNFTFALANSVTRQRRDPAQLTEGAQRTGRSCSFMSQRYLQERSLSSHRQVHGCTLCSRKGWSVAAEGHKFNSVPRVLGNSMFPSEKWSTHIFALLFSFSTSSAVLCISYLLQENSWIVHWNMYAKL